MADTQTVRLSLPQARRFLLAKQGLLAPRSLHGAAGLREVFDRLGCVQYDPLDVVGRNPDLVLQSRVVDYRPQMLQELAYVERHLFDYWDKMVSLIPMAAWPCFDRRRQSYRKRHAEWRQAHEDGVRAVLDAIEEQGEKASIDFTEGVAASGKVAWRWGPIKVAKAALEMLWDCGELMVSRRYGSRRYYDLTRRVLPTELDAPSPFDDEASFTQWKVARRCSGIGLVGPALGGNSWAGVGKAADRSAATKALVDAGEMISVSIEGDSRQYHMLAADRTWLAEAESPLSTPRVSFIAPLDNLMWARSLVERVFSFSYVWEVYKRPEDRRYGYYVLPVLYGDSFVARFEPKVDRDTKTLRILSWHWEPEASLSGGLAEALREATAQFMAYLQVESVAPEAGVDPEVGQVMSTCRGRG